MPKGKPRSRAAKNIKWIEDYCHIPQGAHVGGRLILPQFMRDDLVAIYDNPAGTRKAIISRGRKNAKTTECACLVLLHLCGPMHRVNSQIYSAAQARDQAAILFNLAAKMVRMSPVLRNAIIIRDTKKELFCPDLGITYRALAAEPSTAYGLSPVLLIHDELGQVKGPRSELYEALETATAAERSPLSVIISTQARTDADLLSTLIDDALAHDDPRTVIRLHTAAEDLDAFGEVAIRAANPAFDEFMNREEVLGMARDAKRMPTRENDYRNLVLNQRVDATASFVSLETWRSNGAPPQDLAQCEQIFGGLDLSATADLTALVLIGKVGEVWQVHPQFWLPADGLLERARLDRVPYDLWHKQGHLNAAPGKSINYEFVAARLFELFHRYPKAEIRIAFDRWNFKHFKPYLLRAGFDEEQIERHFVEFGQGFASMSPALRELESHLLNARLAHGNHPVLAMCARNSTVEEDPARNRKLVKKKTHGRIDGMIALTMAVGTAPQAFEPEPDYQIMILGGSKAQQVAQRPEIR